jgi:hypothetical protein
MTATNPQAAKGSMGNLACTPAIDTGFPTIVTDIRDRRIWVADAGRQLVFAFGKEHQGVVHQVIKSAIQVARLLPAIRIAAIRSDGEGIHAIA